MHIAVSTVSKASQSTLRCAERRYLAGRRGPLRAVEAPMCRRTAEGARNDARGIDGVEASRRHSRRTPGRSMEIQRIHDRIAHVDGSLKTRQRSKGVDSPLHDSTFYCALIGETGSNLGSALDRIEYRNGNRHENSDNKHHDHQLNQRESMLRSRRTRLSSCAAVRIAHHSDHLSFAAPRRNGALPRYRPSSACTQVFLFGTPAGHIPGSASRVSRRSLPR